MNRLKKTAADLGLPFSASDRIYNSRLAQELGHWAESKHRGDAFHNAAFEAYFVSGLNIAKISVLSDLAVSIGLSGEEASRVLTARSFKAAVDSDWSLSREKGVRAVPTFTINGDRLVGAQPYQALEDLVKSKGIIKRKGT